MTLRNLAVALVAGSAILASATPSFAKKTPAVAAVPVASADHARFGTAAVNTGAPALQSTILVGHLAGALTKAELGSLTKQFGADDVTSFVKTFNFVVTDAVAKVTAAKVPLPKASIPQPDGKALSAELYTLGVTPDKSFDVEYMLDALVTHGIHVAVMDDIDKDATLGPKADANYHAVLTQVMKDLKSDYKL